MWVSSWARETVLKLVLPVDAQIDEYAETGPFQWANCTAWHVSHYSC